MHHGKAMSPTSRLTGERPQEGVTPDSLLSLHDAGYPAVDRTVRSGLGAQSTWAAARGSRRPGLGRPGRQLYGVDRDGGALTRRSVGRALAWAGADGRRLAGPGGLQPRGRSTWVCSSHLIEHFESPPGAHASPKWPG